MESSSSSWRELLKSKKKEGVYLSLSSWEQVYFDFHVRGNSRDLTLGHLVKNSGDIQPILFLFYEDTYYFKLPADSKLYKIKKSDKTVNNNGKSFPAFQQLKFDLRYQYTFISTGKNYNVKEHGTIDEFLKSEFWVMKENIKRIKTSGIDLLRGDINYLILEKVEMLRGKAKIPQSAPPIYWENTMLTKVRGAGIMYFNQKYAGVEIQDVIKLDAVSFYPSISIRDDLFPNSEGFTQEYSTKSFSAYGIYEIESLECGSCEDSLFSIILTTYSNEYMLGTEIEFFRSIGCLVKIKDGSLCHIYPKEVLFPMSALMGEYVSCFFEGKKEDSRINKKKSEDEQNENKDLYIHKSFLTYYYGTFCKKAEVREVKISSDDSEFDIDDDFTQLKSPEIYKDGSATFVVPLGLSYFKYGLCRFSLFMLSYSRIEMFKKIIEFGMSKDVIRIYVDSFLVKDASKYKFENNSFLGTELNTWRIEGKYNKVVVKNLRNICY